MPGRNLILVHSANNASLGLKGSIAPVTAITGAGKGQGSTNAFKRLLNTITRVIDRGNQVWINIEPLPPIHQPTVLQEEMLKPGNALLLLAIG